MIIYINGKFCAQRTTGTQRVAYSIISALDVLLTSRPIPNVRWVLLCPPTVSMAPRLNTIEVEQLGRLKLPLNFWEQVVLPLRTRGSLLISLCGVAPFHKTCQLCIIHDTAIYDHPNAYARVFTLSRRYLLKRLAKAAPLIPTVSGFSCDRLMHWLNLPRSRFRVVPNGADHIHAIESDSETPEILGLTGIRYLLTVASENPTKNLRRLMEAFAKSGVRDLRLVLVGGENRAVFSDSPAEANSPLIIRTGFIDDPQLKWLYENAEAFLFPSIYEGFGLPPLEAMVCGCPVVVSDIPSLREVCGDAALYFNPMDIESIQDALVRISTDFSLRALLIEQGYIRASRYQWSQSALGLLECVQYVIEGQMSERRGRADGVK